MTSDVERGWEAPEVDCNSRERFGQHCLLGDQLAERAEGLGEPNKKWEMNINNVY